MCRPFLYFYGGEKLQVINEYCDQIHQRSVSHCREVVFAVVVLAIAILSIYSNSLDCSWHFDDEPNIIENPNVHLKDLSFNSINRALRSDPRNPHSLYRPVACLTLALNYYFGGLKVFGYHLVNTSIHLVAAVFLFLFIYHTLNVPLLRARYGPNAFFIALLSTFFWAINPIQTQAVTYIVQRMASMAAMFYIMAMYFYLKGRTSLRGPLIKASWYFACLLCGVLAFGSKENAAMLPISILLFDLFLIQGVTKANAARSGILFLALIFIPIGLGLILKGTSIFSPKTLTSLFEHREFTMLERLLTEPRIIMRYIFLLFYPMPTWLSLNYDIIPSQGLLQPPTTLLSILGMFFILGLAVAISKKRPLISFCILFYFINHVIESSIFPLELIFEHRNYLPSMLFFVPVSIFLAWGINNLSSKKVIRVMIIGFIVLVLIAYGHSTFIRNFTWKTEESLWLDAVDKSPNSARAHHNLGRYYDNTHQSEKAIAQYNISLKLKRGTHGEIRHLTHYNLALVYMKMNELDKAEQQFVKAIEIFPKFSDAYNNLSIVKAKEGKYDDAYRYLIRALTYDKKSFEAHNNLGYILIKKKQIDDAIIEFRKALELKKDFSMARYNLGIAYKYKGELKRAARCFRSALNQDPRALLNRLHLAETYYLMGKKKLATRTISQCFDIFSPEELLSRLKVFSQEKPFQELPERSIILPLLRDAFLEKAASLNRMANELWDPAMGK
jgi:tetratricopeptide (TPR) repeat protein